MLGTRLTRSLALLVVVGALMFVLAASPGGAVPPSNPGGMFVVGDATANAAGPADTVTFWSHSWWKENALSGGAAPAAFKGYAAEVTLCTSACADGLGTWTTGPGNSSHPPDSVSGTITVIIASGITKSGDTISGNIVRFCTLDTLPGYGPNPGHPGTGTNLCGNPE